jgi:hypothetical protein
LEWSDHEEETGRAGRRYDPYESMQVGQVGPASRMLRQLHRVLSEEQAAHQVVIAQAKQDNIDQSSTHVEVVSYGPGLVSTAFSAPAIGEDQLAIVVGVAIGRFSGSDDFGSTPASTNQQIAVLRAAPSPAILVYDVTSLADLTPMHTATDMGIHFNESKNLQGNLLRVGDLQGRSLRLRAPGVVRVEAHSQPIVVIGVPPMHADYVQSVGAQQPDVFNFTVVPTAYNSSYTVDATVKENSSSTSTTSYTYSKKETTSAGVAFKAGGLSAGASAQETIANVQKNTGTSSRMRGPPIT